MWVVVLGRGTMVVVVVESEGVTGRERERYEGGGRGESRGEAERFKGGNREDRERGRK